MLLRMTTYARRSMRWRTAARVALIAVAATLTACGGSSSSDPTSAADPAASVAPSAAAGGGTLRVFAASSLKEVFPKLAEAFSAANEGAKVEFSFAGSDELATQIQEGAQGRRVRRCQHEVPRRTGRRRRGGEAGAVHDQHAGPGDAVRFDRSHRPCVARAARRQARDRRGRRTGGRLHPQGASGAGCLAGCGLVDGRDEERGERGAEREGNRREAAERRRGRRVRLRHRCQGRGRRAHPDPDPGGRLANRDVSDRRRLEVGREGTGAAMDRLRPVGALVRRSSRMPASARRRRRDAPGRACRGCQPGSRGSRLHRSPDRRRVPAGGSEQPS